MRGTMKNKIIVSLLLIFLLAISVSAVSANEDLSDAIDETSDIEDIELSNVNTANAEIMSEVISDDEDVNIDEDDGKTNEDNLGSGVIQSNPVTIKTEEDLSKYLEDRGSTHYGDGTVFLLDRSISIHTPITIKKSYTIEGGIINGAVDNFFTVESPANGGPSSVTIRNTKFLIQKSGQNILLAKGVTQGINGVLNVAGVTLENISITNMVGTETPIPSLLNIESDTDSTVTSNAINITNNTLNGIIALKFNGRQMTHGGLDGDEIYLPANEIIFQKATKLTATYYLQYAVDTSAGDSPFDFIVWLSDEDGYAVVNRTITFALNSIGYTAKTNENGEAHLKLSISKAGTYDIYSQFIEEDEQYSKSDMVASTIQILKKDSTFALKNVSYKADAKTKKLTATFKVPVYEFVFDGNAITQKLKSYQYIKNKKVTFTVNGKSYSATTNSKGVATVKISLNKKGKYTYKAKFAGDGTYKAVTKSATLTIKPLATSLTLKKYTYKKSSKSKKLKATLKSGTKVLKNKKVSFKVNGKTYSAKTNSKGIATVKIKLTKKGTFKYTAKFAGDNVYKAISKSNKVVIK